MFDRLQWVSWQQPWTFDRAIQIIDDSDDENDWNLVGSNLTSERTMIQTVSCEVSAILVTSLLDWPFASTTTSPQKCFADVNLRTEAKKQWQIYVNGYGVSASGTERTGSPQWKVFGTPCRYFDFSCDLLSVHSVVPQAWCIWDISDHAK
jgi:hypothetical protein